MNDKRNGIGKEYDKDGDLIFEGEFLFGEEYKGIKRKYYKVEPMKSKVDFDKV